MDTGNRGRKVLAGLLLALALVWAFAPASAEAGEWKPTKPIQFIVPYAPGGGSDVLARSIGQVIQEPN